MITPNSHPREAERLQELQDFNILDTLPEEEYNALARIAAQICGVPISLITLLDDTRQWFKAHHGIHTQETPKEYAFCAHAIHQHDNVMIVPDARQDERFHDNPLVTNQPHVIFYAGMPLVTEQGLPLGTLCVIDTVPRELTDSQIQVLRDLAGQVMRLLYLRKRERELEETLKKLEQKNKEVERFAYSAAHDLKSPLNQINSFVEILALMRETISKEEEQEIFTHLQTASTRLVHMVNDLLAFGKSGYLKEDRIYLTPAELEIQVRELLTHEKAYALAFHSTLKTLYCHPTAIREILLNLINNAIKYSLQESTEVTIAITENKTHYWFSVKDNGIGIHPDHHAKIFEPFETVAQADRFGRKGSGLGLAIVRKMVETLDGSISVTSQLEQGSTFTFSVAK